MSQDDRYKQAKKTTLIGALINVLLGFLKLAGGIVFHSHALIADGIHSFSDILTDLLVIFASKYGSQEADLLHPYGHQRIETAATLLLATLLILVGAGIAWDSLHEVFHLTVHKTKWLALPVAIISILVNEWLFRYTQRVGKNIQSALLIANAWHHRSDAAASGIVLIGIIGVLIGFEQLDLLAAIIIGVMIIKMGLVYGWNSVKELVDTGLDPQKVAEIEQVILQVNGVQKIHQLRNRMMGKDIFIDVHILVSPMISVSEGHYIAQHVHNALIKKIVDVKDVTVHVDPEDDELGSPSFSLQSRQNLEHLLIKNWRVTFPAIESYMVHYLDGKITIDIIVNSSFEQTKNFTTQIEQDMAAVPEISQINLLKNLVNITRISA